MIRPERGEVPAARTTTWSGRSVLPLLGALAMLLAALAGPVGHASDTAPPVTAQVTIAAALAGVVPGPVVTPPAPGHSAQGAPWWWLPADSLLVAALLASVLLAVARSLGTPARSRQARPPGRAPPSLALPH